jgi:hypothetical protein
MPDEINDVPADETEAIAERSATSDSPVARHRIRRVASLVLVVLAALLVPVATLAVWTSRTALDTGRFASTVSNVTSDPAVLAAVSTRITDEAFDAVDGSAVLDQLPPVLQRAVPIIQGALRSRVEQRVNDLLSSDAGQRLLTAAVKEAHASALRLLEGDGLLSSKALSVENGTVTLDVRPIIRRTLLALQADGVIPSSVTIPADGEPPGALATAIGSRLPDDFGRIVVYRTDADSFGTTLKDAQRGLVLTKRGVVLLVIVALGLAAAAIVVAVDRRRALYRVGLGVAIGAVLVLVAARRVTLAIPDAATTAGSRAIATALTDALRASFTRTFIILILVAAVVAVLARTWNGLYAWAGRHADIARIAVVGVGLFLLVVLGLGWGALILAVAVAGGGLLTVQSATHARVAALDAPTPS